jgi:xylan 1,4-beta-xylosidase
MALALRKRYQSDLGEVKRATDVKYVRGHAIFHDELSVYSEEKQGNAAYNFTNVDQIYDALLAQGVRPIVEISFIPKQLASDFERNSSVLVQTERLSPKNCAKWDDLIRSFARNLVERRGISGVSQSYFEVWNEPNIAFWAGNPKQNTYFELYEYTARALKPVSPELKVGGPATAVRGAECARHEPDQNGTARQVRLEFRNIRPDAEVATRRRKAEQHACSV